MAGGVPFWLQPAVHSAQPALPPPSRPRSARASARVQTHTWLYILCSLMWLRETSSRTNCAMASICTDLSSRDRKSLSTLSERETWPTGWGRGDVELTSQSTTERHHVARRFSFHTVCYSISGFLSAAHCRLFAIHGHNGVNTRLPTAIDPNVHLPRRTNVAISQMPDVSDGPYLETNSSIFVAAFDGSPSSIIASEQHRCASH